MAEQAIPFDQYQRYGMAALAIDRIRHKGEAFRILEVGAPHGLLGKLLPADSITYLDLELQPEMRERENVLVGDATDLKLSDGSFDIVVSLDVYEHIPPRQRRAFLMHTTRVARTLSVLGAPFHSGPVLAAENEAREYWLKLFDTPYRWLAEHAEHGLPDLDWTVKNLAALGLHQLQVRHGDLKLWQAYIKSHFAKEYEESLKPLVSILDRYYHDHLFARDFFPLECYRHFIFCSRDPDLGRKIRQAIPEPSAETSQAGERELILHLLQSLSAGSEGKAFARKEAVDEAKPDLLQQNPALQLVQITNLCREIAERDNRNAILSQTLEEQRRETESLKQALADRDWKIEHLAGERLAILQSTSWRITCPLRFAGHQLKRTRHLLQLMPHIFTRGGGIRSTAWKTLTVLRREGRTGLRSRMIFLQNTQSSGTAHGDDYQEWIRRYDQLTTEIRQKMGERMSGFARRPLISVIMPVYNPHPQWLAAAIESVQNQLYPAWQLCIADDASTNQAIRPILERYAREDSRIRVTFRERNGHISLASNSALELATGEWIALLDHDDLLSEHALFWVADTINRFPRAQLIYSDEDKIDLEGRRSAPYFKCDWNLDLFYSHNLITHLGVYRTERVRKLGGFRKGFEGAQDYDLALRYIEGIDPEQIIHVPRVLYHWRVHPESTAQRAEAKPYAMLAGEMALNEHLTRQKLSGRAEFIGIGYRVRYALPENPPLVTIIIPTRNGLELLERCLASLLAKTCYPDYEVLVVDNGSDDPATLRYLEKQAAEPRVRVLRDDGPFNFSALNNRAVAKAHGELICLLNNDIEVITPTWLDEMVAIALQPRVGAVGASLWYPNNSLQHGGIILGPGGVAGHAHRALKRGEPGYAGRAVLQQSFSAVTGACLVVRKELYQQAGGLNEENLAIAFNDVEFCLRLRKQGFRNVWTPHAELYHHESATRGYENTPEKHSRFQQESKYMQQRWGELLLNDPAYSPNLTLAREDFGLAWPPRVAPAPEIGTKPTNKANPSPVGLSRIEKALYRVDQSGLGLEIGPSHNPIVPKRAGFRVHILDHAPAAALREKYRGHGVDLDRIEEVDFVWRGEPLPVLIGTEACYDYIIASHVIEHTPDLLGFLCQCERLLKPGGNLSLVIPDKRYCFDYLCAPSSTGEVLDAHQQKRRRPSPGKVWDHYANATKRNGEIAWSPAVSGELTFVHQQLTAVAQYRSATDSQLYLDVHNWRFTPAGFRLLIHDLNTLGFIRLREKCFFDTEECDFFLTLVRAETVKVGRAVDRMALSLALHDEISGIPQLRN